MRWLSMSSIFSRAISARRMPIALPEPHQQRALEQAAAGIDQTCHFLQAQDLG